jgi:hypothetical protein
MTEADSFFITMLFGVIGMAYFVYGKKNARLIPLFCGMGLCAFPYFISGTTAILLVGTTLVAVPWFWRADA